MGAEDAGETCTTSALCGFEHAAEFSFCGTLTMTKPWHEVNQRLYEETEKLKERLSMELKMWIYFASVQMTLQKSERISIQDSKQLY